MVKTEQAEFLIEAVPYIKTYSNKIIVVKYGGSAMTDEETTASIMEDLVLLNLLGIKVVLVHGGGFDITEVSQKMGKESVFVNGLRYTDKETAEIARMVLCGKTGKYLVDMICKKGGKAIGLCGQDANMIQCKCLDKNLGYVGQIIDVNTKVIEYILEDGYIPVISPIGGDSIGNTYNINGDTMASCIAGALGAESLILMTNTNGVLRDKKDPNSTIKTLNISDIPFYEKQGIISDGMIPKIDCCKEAIRKGVNKVFITNGQIPHSILIEILSEEGSGTMFCI